jgi:ABC-type nickel/cobalt efflux system permease component RcnA
MRCTRQARICALILGLLALVPTLAIAHPVPRRSHDRTIVVTLHPDRVVVQYQLDVDPFTIVYDDLPAVDDKVDLTKLKKPADFYDAFARVYAPILADNLDVKLDGKPLKLRCTARNHTLRGKDDRPLDHLRCDFVFQADWKLAEGEKHTLAFHEGNYELEAGRVRLSLANEAAVELLEKSEPDRALQELPERELKPGDDAKLRKASTSFHLISGEAAADVPKPESVPQTPQREPSGVDEHGDHGLFNLLFDTERGFWVLLWIAAVLGAAHALTPGHGKTLVAAYLVGERGTVWHAVLLGLSVTLSHTGGVILVAVILKFYLRGTDPAAIQSTLEIVAGLLVTGLGFWLLLRRLGGGADHVHIGGIPHSHGDGATHTHGHGADHDHEHGHGHGAGAQPVGAWGVIVLGLAGGIVPCTDAIILLLLMPQRALPLVLAFSAGLAAMLVAVGIGVVYIKGFAESRWGQGKIVRALPLVSAAFITAMGLWMCFHTLHRGV